MNNASTLFLTIVLVSSILGSVYYHGYSAGYDAKTQEVEQANAKAEKQAKEGLDSYQHCIDRGGVWSQSTGKCSGNVR